MNPLMYEGLLPDSRQVSRDAAECHAILTARGKRHDALRLRSRHPIPLTRRGDSTWFSRSQSPFSVSSG